MAPQQLGLQNCERQWKTSQRSPQVGKGGGYPEEGPRPEIKRKAQLVLGATSAMSKSDMMRKYGAKSSTPTKITSTETMSETQTFVKSKKLTIMEVAELERIDPRATMDRLVKWVENWESFKTEVGKVEEMNDEQIHDLMGSAQIYASEVDGRIITAVMLEMAMRGKYVFMPEAMRSTKVEKPNQYTTLDGDTMSAIRVDRDNWIQETWTIDVSKEKTLKLLEAMSKMSYFDEIMTDLQRKICNKGNQFTPMQLYWPKRNWIETDLRSAWQSEIVPDITCNLTPMTVIPAVGKRVAAKYVAAVVIPNFDYAITSRGQHARAGAILKDDIQSAIGAMPSTPNIEEAMSDLCELERFDVMLAKTPMEEKKQPFDAKQLQFTAAYLLVTDDIDGLLVQLEEVQMLDTNRVKSNILIKPGEATILNLMGKALHLLNDEFQKTNLVVPRGMEEAMYEALNAIISMDDEYVVPPMRDDQENDEHLSTKIHIGELPPRSGAKRRLDTGTEEDANGDAQMADVERTSQSGEARALLRQWEAYICKVTVTAYRKALTRSTELGGEKPMRAWRNPNDWSDAENQAYIQQIVAFMYAPANDGVSTGWIMETIKGNQAKLLLGEDNDPLAYARTRVSITTDPAAIAEHLETKKQADVRAALSRHAADKMQAETGTVITIKADEYGLFMGRAQKEAILEKALQIY